MVTKKNLIEPISFQYLKEFVAYTKILRRSKGYFTKKDFVRGLVRNLSKYECAFLHREFTEGIPSKKVAKTFNSEVRPGEEIVRSEFVRWLNNEVASDEEETMHPEFPIGDNRADIARFNGKSYSYELKSPRDSAKRIPEQVATYKQVFDHVYLVVDGNLDLKDYPGVGVIKYDVPSFSFEIVQESDLFSPTAPQAQLNRLRIHELQEMSELDEGLSKGEYIENVRSILDPKEINSHFIQKMKTRSS